MLAGWMGAGGGGRGGKHDSCKNQVVKSGEL